MRRVDRFHRHAGGLDGAAVRMILVPGEHRTGAQRGPRVPGQRTARDARTRDEQDETAHPLGVNGTPVDGVGDGELTASLSDGPLTVPLAKSQLPYRGLTCTPS